MEQFLVEHPTDRPSSTYTVSLTGNLDLSRKEELTQRFLPLANMDVAIIDLADVGYLDSTALGCLIGLKNRMIQNGKRGVVIVAGSRPTVKKIFQICGLDRVFAMYDSVTEAQQAIKAIPNGRTS